MPTPRKHSKRAAAAMYVTSIRDFERAQEMQPDLVLDSAVDQLEAMADPDGMRSQVADIMMRFGEMKIGEHVPLLRFDFDPPTTCKPWPGPRYGFLPLHKELVKHSGPKTKSKSKSKSSKKHGHAEEWRQTASPRKVSKPKMVKKADERPSTMTSVASRDPPLHILSLPPELRVAIWNELALHTGSLEAQIRQVMPCKKTRESKTKVLRRFPLEPVLAMANKQIRREVLSIYYGSNRFVLVKNPKTVFEGLSITSPTVMQKWLPTGMARFLSHLTINFRASTRLFPFSTDFAVVYDLRRLSTGKIIPKVHYLTTGGRIGDVKCICQETEVLAEVQASGEYADLAELSLAVSKHRLAKLFGDQPAESAKPEKFYPSKVVCEKCSKDTFHSISSGL